MHYGERFRKIHSREAWAAQMGVNPAIRGGSFGDWDDSLDGSSVRPIGANATWDWNAELSASEARGQEVAGTQERLRAIRDEIVGSIPGIHTDQIAQAMKFVSLAFAEVRGLARAAA